VDDYLQLTQLLIFFFFLIFKKKTKKKKKKKKKKSNLLPTVRAEEAPTAAKTLNTNSMYIFTENAQTIEKTEKIEVEMI